MCIVSKLYFGMTILKDRKDLDGFLVMKPKIFLRLKEIFLLLCPNT